MAEPCSMCSMCGGFIFHSLRPSLKVRHSQCLTSVTKHDSGGSPPGAACYSAKLSHDKTQCSASGWRSFNFRMAEPIKPISTKLSLTLTSQLLLQCLMTLAQSDYCHWACDRNWLWQASHIYLRCSKFSWTKYANMPSSSQVWRREEPMHSVQCSVPTVINSHW